MYLVDLTDATLEIRNREDLDENVGIAWDRIADDMEDRESLWIYSPNIKTFSGFLPLSQLVAQRAKQKGDFVLRNIISRYKEGESTSRSQLEDTYDDILFFVKDMSEFYFNKDRIRVDPVYKGNEWHGMRTHNESTYHGAEVRRYNPEGKDPGNVWLTEIRDESDDETIDRWEPVSKVEAVERCIRAGSEKSEVIKCVYPTDEVDQAIENTERKSEPMTEVYT
ncbi:DNA methyltransferase [Halosimplex halobium]|uniref:DNA methyltransferase n=1 Tax=Halosimplex halobium TaxID=3396618 RepID=UPI003F55FE23